MSARKLTLQEVAKIEGYESIEDMLAFYLTERVIPACCEDGCEVKPDGECFHGHPSIFIEFGF